MSDKPNLPLGEIAGYDQGKLKKTEVADKSGVSDHDKLLATVAGGQVNLKVRDAYTQAWRFCADLDGLVDVRRAVSSGPLALS